MIALTQDLLKHRSIKRWPKKRTSHKWVTSKIFPLNVTNVWQFTRATPSMIGFILVLFSASNKKGPSDKVSFCFNASFFFVPFSLWFLFVISMITSECIYPFQNLGILTGTEEIWLTDSRIDSTKSGLLTFFVFAFVNMSKAFAVCDVGVRFWCAKLPNNISINFVFDFLCARATNEWRISFYFFVHVDEI